MSAIKLFKLYPWLDLVITETKLPKISGFIVLNEIHAIKPDIPIIAQTASVLGNMRKRCLDAGFIESISKPIDLSLFELLVNKYIHKTSDVEL